MAMVRFGDVAERVNTKEDRFNTDLVYYVGGDHIESNALTVSGRGKIKEADLGPMFYFGFKPGDILFVTRNPHLRKCALVNFSGICSEKTLVIGTKDENVLSQKYLATVMQSDDFWEFMEENKSGSVNYFVNWTTLADYEFNLPSLARQHELAELLWAANDLKESYKKAITATDEMLKAKFREMKFREMFGECGGQGAEGDCSVSKWPLVRIAEVVTDVRYGTSKPGDKDGVYAYLRMNNLTDDGGLDLTDLKRITLSGEDFEKCVVRRGDILFNRTNTKELVGKTAYYDLDDDMVIAGYIIRVRVDKDKIDPRYLWKLMNTVELKTKLRHMAKGAIHQANINAQELQSIEIPLPPLSLQREFVAIADKAESAKANLKKSIAAIDQVMKGLINQ